MSNAVTTLNSVKVTTQDVRADRLRLGDVLLLPRLPELGGGWETTVVRSLELLGDDVEVNGTLSTSQSNKLTVLR